jgi:MFS family permease
MAAGGLLISRYSAETVYALPVLTYAISVLALWRLQGEFAPASSIAAGSAISEIVDTIRSLQENRALFWSIALFGFGLLFITGIDRIALPALSDRQWQAGPDGLGLIMASFAIGNVVASLGIGHLKMHRHALAIFTGWALWGLFYALVGISPWFALALAFAFMAGAAEALIDVPLVMLIQTTVARERMGKVFSMWSTTAFIGDAASALFAGFVVGLLGPQHAYVVAGACLVGLAALGLALTRALRASTATPSFQPDP